MSILQIMWSVVYQNKTIKKGKSDQLYSTLLKCTVSSNWEVTMAFKLWRTSVILGETGDNLETMVSNNFEDSFIKGNRPIW
jgi:hypothetical protein